jgi:hypothetical protein
MNGHNPNKNYQSDEHQDVAALLRGLPQVAAPVNFDMMLKARIAQAKVEQKADVTALLQELPRVAAPADFDFKLRSRIAQAKYKEEKVSPLGWFSEIFGRSMMQAGAAMAAVALIVGAVTFQMMKPVDKPSQPIANNTVTETIIPMPSPESTKPIESTGNPKAGNIVAASLPIRNSRATTVAVKFVPPTPKTKDPRPKTNDRIIETEVAPSPSGDLIASNTVLIKHSSSGETRVVKVAEVSFGLQSASLRSNSPREPQNVEIASAQIIY